MTPSSSTSAIRNACALVRYIGGTHYSIRVDFHFCLFFFFYIIGSTRFFFGTGKPSIGTLLPGSGGSLLFYFTSCLSYNYHVPRPLDCEMDGVFLGLVSSLKRNVL